MFRYINKKLEEGGATDQGTKVRAVGSISFAALALVLVVIGVLA